MPDVVRKKVLIISFVFPPAGGSRVQRALKFAKYLPVFGWQTHVMTAGRMPELRDTSLLEEVPPEVKVERVFSPDPASMKESLEDARRHGMNKMFYFVFRAVLKVYSMIYFRMATVDWYEGWLPFALKAAEKTVRSEGIDVIYVHGQPPSTFLVGHMLKQRTGKPLVLDYDDSWTTSVYARRDNSRNARKARKMEHEVLLSADAVLSVKHETIEGIKASFPDIDAGKMFFLPNGYDPDDYTGIARKQGGKFTVTYAGRLSEKFCYSPESFLRALGELVSGGKIPGSDIEVDLAGTISPSYAPKLERMIKDLGLGGVVKFKGFLNHKESIELLMRSDLLLLLIESSKGREESCLFSGSMPAKLFEYMYTGVPILGIVPRGFEADLIMSTGTGFIAEPNNVSSVKEVLGDIYARYKAGRLEVKPVREEIAKYDRKTLAGGLAEIMDGVVEERGEGKS